MPKLTSSKFHSKLLINVPTDGNGQKIQLKLHSVKDSQLKLIATIMKITITKRTLVKLALTLM
jgi:hypothetical protein